MSYSVNNVPTRIRPVGVYSPSRSNVAVPVNPTPAPSTGGGVTVPAGVKNFFGDVWSGSVDQLKNNGKRVLNPVDTAKDAIDTVKKGPVAVIRSIFDPYVNEIKAGHAGRAVGKLVANVATIGGAILGGRLLFGRLGGGASVGTSGPLGNFFSGVGNVIGKVTRPIGNVVGSVFHGLGNAVKWLLPGGGGAGVGFR